MPDEQPSIEVVTLADKAPKKSIEDILIMSSNLLMATVMIIVLVRLIAQQEIKKALPTQAQRDTMFDIASRAFVNHEWRVRQIARTEAYNAVSDLKEDRKEPCENVEESPPPASGKKHQ